MNIVVRHPKKTLASKDKKSYFFPLAKYPSNLKIADMVYFVDHTGIKYYRHFFGFVMDPMCEDGSISPGMNLFLGEAKEVNIPFDFFSQPSFKYITF
jgi:hypothetical protein